MGLALVTCSAEGRAQQPRPPVYVTYDWTPAGATDPLREAWADIKIPGDGNTYKVGTIEVRDTSSNARFSADLSALPNISKASPALPTIAIQGPVNRRQVAVIQLTDDSTEALGQQRFFYAHSDEDGVNATNARAISVWPAASAADMRIAICGEHYDRYVLASQAPGGWPAANGDVSTGFIAVFDGNLTLLWTHHFYGGDEEANAAITDLSIRREWAGGQSGWQDVVTYCGISTHGNPLASAGTPLEPVLPFDVANLPNGASPGDVHHNVAPTRQWDGFVGRLRRDSATTVDFHSIVGGPGQDGLFGIVELDRDRFVVGGQAQLFPCQVPCQAALHFPFSQGPLTGVETVGAVILFDATPTRAQNRLVLVAGRKVGSGQVEGRRTEVRDVAVGWRATKLGDNLTPAADDAVYFCGLTNDESLSSTMPLPTAGPPYGGGSSDGFVGVGVAMRNLALADDLYLHTMCYSGLPSQDGYTGVGLWNEFAHHVAVCGYAEGLSEQLGGDPTSQAANLDLLAATYFFDNSPSPTGYGLQLHPVRMQAAAGNGDEMPAVQGHFNCLVQNFSGSVTPSWSTFGVTLGAGTSQLIGMPAAGGVAVAPTGRVSVVGSTTSFLWTQSPLDRGPDVSGGGNAAVPDALRAKFDLLPLGVGRTDGGGDPLPITMPAGMTGGTSPACALSQFGIVIQSLVSNQDQLVVPEVTRMLADYQGQAPTGANVLAGSAILVSRPAAAGAGDFLGIVGQLAIPGSSAPFVLMPEGVEIWASHSSAVIAFSAILSSSDSYRKEIAPGIPVGIDFAFQLFVARLPSFTPPSGCAANGTMVASPAIWVRN